MTDEIMYFALVADDGMREHGIGYFNKRREAMARAKSEALRRGQNWDWSVDKVRVLHRDRYGEVIAVDPLVRWSSYAGKEELA